MKIIEALKELPLIQKKIEKQDSMIENYAAAVDNGRTETVFDTPDQQQQEVNSLVQSNMDLVARYCYLKRQLAITNATVKVEIEGVTRTISEWITYRNFGAEAELRTLSRLNDRTAVSLMRSTPVNPEKGIKVVKFYDEKRKNDKIDLIEKVKGKIDGTLEIVNATTDLCE